MTRRLILFRHGKSDHDADFEQDRDRPLNERGREDARRMGSWLRDQDLAPDEIISSPAVRARTTAKIAAEAMGLDPEDIRIEDDLYAFDANQLLRLIPGLVTQGTVMLVGHNPAMADVAGGLSTTDLGTSDSGKVFPTATVAVFDLPAGSQLLSRSSLVALARPAELDRAIAP